MGCDSTYCLNHLALSVPSDSNNMLSRTSSNSDVVHSHATESLNASGKSSKNQTLIVRPLGDIPDAGYPSQMGYYRTNDSTAIIGTLGTRVITGKRKYSDDVYNETFHIHSLNYL